MGVLYKSFCSFLRISLKSVVDAIIGNTRFLEELIFLFSKLNLDGILEYNFEIARGGLGKSGPTFDEVIIPPPLGIT